MKLAEIIWNGNEAEIWFTKEWRASDLIVRLDAIQDTIHALKKQYNYELAHQIERAERGAKPDTGAQTADNIAES